MKVHILVVMFGLLILAASSAVKMQRQQKEKVDFSNYGSLNEVAMRFEGMTCPSCSVGIGTEIERLDGVVQAIVDFPTKTGFVIYEPEKITEDEIREFANALYPATIIEDEQFNQ